MVVLDQKDFEEESKVYKSITDRFNMDEIPRFKINGMNQNEFIHHLIASAFYSGVRYERSRNKENP